MKKSSILVLNPKAGPADGKCRVEILHDTAVKDEPVKKGAIVDIDPHCASHLVMIGKARPVQINPAMAPC